MKSLHGCLCLSLVHIQSYQRSISKAGIVPSFYKFCIRVIIFTLWEDILSFSYFLLSMYYVIITLHVLSYYYSDMFLHMCAQLLKWTVQWIWIQIIPQLYTQTKVSWALLTYTYISKKIQWVGANIPSYFQTTSVIVRKSFFFPRHMTINYITFQIWLSSKWLYTTTETRKISW